MGVTSQNSRRMGQTSRAAQRPRVWLKSSEGRIWLQKTTTSTTAEDGLRDLGRGGPRQVRGAIEEHRAELQRDDAQRKLLQHRRGNGHVFAAQAQLRLNLLFPGVEVVLHLAG